MKKKFTKVVSCLLCLAMLFSMAAPALAVRAEDDAIAIDAPATEEDSGLASVGELPAEDPSADPLEADGEYEIYPTPHSVTYGTGTVTLPATMQVTYGAGIDQYTKARAVDAFQQAGVTLSESAATSVKLNVSIKADGDGVTTTTADLFDKYDAYKLTIDQSGVTVVGKDTDAAFYGLTTVKLILQQVQNRQVKLLTVEDYADVPFRGFIEGYYGNPWTTEDRQELMRFGGDYKMNIYFYAPKDDPKHNAQWRVLYTEDELENKIKPLAEAGNESKCYFGFALHPFMYNAISFGDNYATDLQILKDKFEQAMSVGVRQIAVLADDAGVPGNNAANYVTLMNDLTEWVSSDEMQTKYPGLKTSIPFCPNDYMGNGSSAQLQTLKNFPDSVPVVMTGGRIWGHVEHSFLNTYRNNMGDGPFLWVNWPCTDNDKTRLAMGGHGEVLHSDLTAEDVAALKGIMLNPMQQSEPSKAGIFYNADYAWNVWNGDDSAERIAQVWDDSFKYIDHDGPNETAESAALRELSKHMIDHSQAGGDQLYAESVELAPKLSEFRTKLSAGTLTAADITAMRAEFVTLKNAATTYKNKTTGNTRILGQRTADGYVANQEQMAPWLDTWEEFAQSAVELLDVLALNLDNADGYNDSQIVEQYLTAQNLLNASKTHAFQYTNEMKNARVGGRYLEPFVNALMTSVAEVAQTIIDPSVLLETVITNREDTPEGGLAAMRDGKDSTEAVFKKDSAINVGDYVGVQYNKPITLNSVRFEVGRSANAADNFNGAKLQYMDASGQWQDIPGGAFPSRVATMEVTGLNLNAKGVRAIATAAVTGKWFGVKEIYINGKSGGAETEDPTAGAEKYTIQSVSLGNLVVAPSGGQLSSMTDGDPSTVVMLRNSSGADNCPANAYVELNLGAEKQVGSLVVTVDPSKPADSMTTTVQYWDGSAWQDIQSGLTEDFALEITSRNITTSKLRLLNPAEKGCWVRFAEVAVYGPTPQRNDADKLLYRSDVLKRVANPVGALTDDSAVLSADNVMLRPGEFLGLSLPGVSSVTKLIANYTFQPDLVLMVGVNESELVEVTPAGAQLLADEENVTDFTGLARYVRLENVGTQTLSFVLDELSVEFEPVNAGEGVAYVGADGCQPESAGDDPLAWFDGDVNSRAKFAYDQAVGNWVLFDLTQPVEIRSLRATINNTDPDYPRNGVWEFADSQDGPWTPVLTITTTLAEGQEDYNNPPSTNGSPEWQHDTANYFYQENTLDTPVTGRYLRYRVTSASRNYLRFNEITINGGEYISTFSDPTFVAEPAEVGGDFTPNKLTDGNLTSGFRPNMDGETSGSLIYRVSDDTSIGQINLVQDATPGVTVSVRPAGEDDFVELATLSGGFSQIPVPENIANIAEVKFSWGRITPTLYEMVLISRAAAVESGGQAPSEVETIPINSYSGDARKINFDENWKFNLGDVSGAEALVFNDSSWRTLNLPHDFSIEQDYTSAGEAESGYLPGGTGWYRKNFTISPDWEDSTSISIDFGGAYMETEVYLNGHKLGENKNGYNPFSFVLPAEHLNYTGENVIAVKVVNTIPSSRWYSGSGIYRSVNLTVTNPVHVARYGTYVNPVKGSGTNWTVNIKTDVQNDTASAANVTVEQAIYELDPDTYEKGAKFAETSAPTTATLAAGATSAVTQTITVSDPKLWNSWDRGEPNLYVLVTTVKQGDTVVDTYETEFGFRTIEFTTDEGFKLNDVNTKLKGVCMHHDQGALGAEAWYRAMERQVEILMDMGCNSIRVTHNPADDGLIEICNRKGILIIDEAFDCWDRSKNGNSNDFARFFNTAIASDNAVVGGEGKTWSQFVLESMVNRDKNAPCVIMYSLGNEILQTGTHAGFIQIIQNLESWVHSIDSTRPVTMGDDSRTTTVSTNENTTDGSLIKAFVNTYLATHNGVIGFNYCNTRPSSGRDVMGNAHANGWFTYGSETASHVNSRGVYNIKGDQALNSDKLLTSYDKSRVGWGDTAAGAWWYTIRFDYNMGEYVWTGFDYIGEPTPNNGTGTGWVNGEDSPKSSFFGIVDTNGIPKDSYYLYRSMWNETDTTLHVLPTWDEEDLLLSSGNAEVVAYTNAPVVRVYLNGVEVGAAKANETTTDAGHKYRTYEAAALRSGGTNTFQAGSTSHGGDLTGTAMYATFNIPYEAGTLELRAFASEAATTPMTGTVGRSVVRTTDGAKSLVASADRKTIRNDGKDLSYVTIDVVDSKGEIVNGATPEIKVSVTGDGVLMGLDNGVQPDHTSYLSDTRKAGAGRLVAIIQSTKDEGSFTVTATSAGLTPAAVTVSTGGAVTETGGNAPVSYDLSKTIYVQLNTEPELPETAVVTLGNGTKETKAITWNSYDKSLLGVSGAEFAITGTIADYGIAVSIGVVVLDDVVALLNYSTAVQVGQTPELPATRPAVMADGTVVAAQFAVTWDEPDAKLYNKAGKVIVNGTAEVFGKTYDVTATVRVAAPSYVDGGEATSGTTYYEDGVSVGATGNAPAWADGDPSVWTGSGALGYTFDTAQNVYKIALTYQGTPPTGGVTFAVSGTSYDRTEAAQSWQSVHTTRTVDGSTVTYQLDAPFSAEAVKLTFAHEVHLVDVVLTTGLSVFDIGSTAELDDMKVNGQSVNAAQLAAKSIRTTAINGVINPISENNVAVTILPENKNSQIVIVTESEDHAQRAIYTVQLDAPEELAPTDATNDYPYAQTTATAPSQAATSGSDSASAAVDNSTSTHWHTNWNNGDQNTLGSQPERRYIQLELAEATDLVALRYLPRQDGSVNGRITKYEVWVSSANSVTAESKDSFVKVSEGSWENNASWKIAMFSTPSNAKFVRLYSVTAGSDSGGSFISAAELRVVKYVPSDKIDLSEATITVEPSVFEWKNVGIRPGTGTEGATVTVTLRGQVLVRGVDYELGYENNIDPGTAYIYARAKDGTNYQGAAAATFTIVRTDAKITSFRPITIPVQPGIDPTADLPKTVMAFTDSADGQPMEVEVTWDTVPAEWYNFPQVKTRTLTGTVDPDMLSKPDLVPTITLKFAYSQSVDTVTMITTPNVVPALPDTVTVQFDDGTSGRRTVSKWYLASHKDDADKPALTTADFASGTVQLMGDIVGIDRVKASASVRVAEGTASNTNFAQNDAVRGGATVGSLPLAISWEGCPADNPFNATNGAHPNSTADGKKIWCDWERGDYNDGDWFGVIFGDGDQVQSKFVNKIKLWFVQESAANGCKPPQDLKIQYYDGPSFDYYTQLSVANEDRTNKTNGMVSAWGSDHPFAKAANWKDVTGAVYPAAGSYTAGTEYEISFDTVDTKVIRVVFTHQANQWIGLDEMEVYGLNPPAANSDFTATVTLGGETLNKGQFTLESEGVYVLERTLPANSDATAGIPKLAVTATNNASTSVIQAVRVPGVPEAGRAWAQAVVTSEDGGKTETYIIKFTREGAAAGFFIELDENFPSNKLQLVDAAGHPVTGGTPNAEITIRVSRGYQAQVWVEITEGDRLGELVTVSNNKFLMPAASVHVYGSAIAVTYQIQYLLNGGNFTGDPRVTYNVETATFTVNDPTRPGYTFQGWVGGGLTQPTKGLTITQGSIGDRTYTAVWEANATIGGGGGNNGGSIAPVGDTTVTTKNPDGSTTVTTTTPSGLVSAVTTAADGTQSAVIQIPQNSGSIVDAAMPELTVDSEKTPQVTVQNNTGRPLSVTIPVDGAGTVVAVRTNADGSETVIPYSIVDDSGLRIRVEDGTHTLRLMDNKKSFDDVADNHWAAGSVDFVSSRELFNGMGTTATFAPTAAMDRAMLTTVLWRLAEKPDATTAIDLFDDVQSGAYYEQAVAWGVASGVVKGTDNGFEPNAPVSRETLAVMLYRAAGSPAVVDEMPRRFTDGAQVASWAQEAMIWCIQNDIIKGYPDNTLGSKNFASRAEVATMLQRFVDHQI